MKIHELTRRAGGRTASAWPPRWIGHFQAGDTLPMPGDGVLASVMSVENPATLLRLTMRFDAREHTGILRWDTPPTLFAVESLLRANLGRAIQAIGEIEV
jgi:hypothetical protein